MAPIDDQAMGAGQFPVLLNKHYHGDIGSLVMLMTSGGYEVRDVDVLEDANLGYQSFRVDIDGDQRAFLRKKNGRWKPIDRLAPFQEFNRFLDENSGLVNAVVHKLSPRIAHGMCDGTSATTYLAGSIEPHLLSKKQVRRSSLNDCEVCGVPLLSGEFLSEGTLERDGQRAAMCADCTVYYSAHFKPGQIKLFQRVKRGGWHLAADPMEVEHLSKMRLF